MSDTINVSNISFDKGKIKGCSVSISGKIFTVKWEGGQYNVEAGGTAASPAAGAPASDGSTPPPPPPASDGSTPPPADASNTKPPAAGSGGKNEYNTQTELITELNTFGYQPAAVTTSTE
jgi:hypothetical protein